jgi:hypothetical protein
MIPVIPSRSDVRFFFKRGPHRKHLTSMAKEYSHLCQKKGQRKNDVLYRVTRSHHGDGEALNLTTFKGPKTTRTMYAIPSVSF